MNTPIPHDAHATVDASCTLCLLQEIGRLREEMLMLRDEVGRKSRGLCIGTSGNVVYGTEVAIMETTAWYSELMEYRRKEAREEELQALRAELEHTKRCVRAVCDYTGLTGNEVAAICGKPMVNP